MDASTGVHHKVLGKFLITASEKAEVIGVTSVCWRSCEGTAEGCSPRRWGARLCPGGPEDDGGVRIRTSTIEELPVLQDIERAAGLCFRDIGMEEIADDEPLSLEELSR
ncbi:hypothetical protein ACI2L5_54660, partial [Streptomyces milbemycinicus]